MRMLCSAAEEVQDSERAVPGRPQVQAVTPQQRVTRLQGRPRGSHLLGLAVGRPSMFCKPRAPLASVPATRDLNRKYGRASRNPHGTAYHTVRCPELTTELLGARAVAPIGLQRSGGWGGHMETGSAPDAHWQHTAGGGKAYCAAEPCQKAWRPTHLTPEHLQAASVGRQPSHTKKPELQTSRNQPASPNPAPAKPPSR